jgi:hypothetical protein
MVGMRLLPSSLACAILLVGLAPVFAGARPDAAGVHFFEQKIRPVLVRHCYSCHSAKSKKARGGLRLDTRDGLLKGGDSGPALVPGKPQDSLLLKALRHEETAMPPKGKLPDAVIDDFEHWIKRGAPDPREASSAPGRSGTDLAKGSKFWSFQPPRRPTIPAVLDADWPRTDVDRFLLAALESKELHPIRDAARATLIRRVTLDLVGLPPSPDQIDAFVKDRSPDAYEKVVDRLLASPHFGERWGRHWLDVARYADSNGKDENLTFHHAWRYRDYVISSFNRDKPFDRFLKEQIAGDLLPRERAVVATLRVPDLAGHPEGRAALDSGSQDQRDEQLTGTGFLVVGPKMLFDRDVLKRKMDVVDEQVDTIGRAFLGMSLGCARCHDHKFDPIPTTDYYALAGILSSTHTLDGIKKDNPQVSGWMLRPLGRGGERARAIQLAHQKDRQATAELLRKARAELLGYQGQPASPETARRIESARGRIKALEARKARLDSSVPPEPPLVMAVIDEDKPADINVNIRGNPHVPGPVVPRGFLRAASTRSPKLSPGSSGRLELAEWLASRDNPLTARVFVNRVWMHLFGEGLVRTVDDFGFQGSRPTHPELLDHLAIRFMDDGWSIKKLIRSLVLSRAYQLAVSGDARAAKVDPENELLWRANRRRLEAEVLRDAMLVLSGQLDRSMGGSSVAGLGEQAIDNAVARRSTEKNTRRSVYLPVIRNGLPSIFEVFDFADPDVTTGKRNATIVPTQALFLMNSFRLMDQARLAARRIMESASSDEARLTILYRRALGRVPTAEEKALVLRFLSEQDDELESWSSVCQSMFGCTEFRFVE